MLVTIVRHAYLPKLATLGMLTVGDLTIATLEEAWYVDPDGPGGQRREGNLVESCVPDGRYKLVPHDGAKQKNVWALVNTQLGVYVNAPPTGQRWGRGAILIHAGNSTDNIEGCIAVGMRHGFEGGKPWVYESQKALDALRAVLGRKEHELLIRPTTGTIEISH